MRLSTQDRDTIRRLVADILGPDSQVWLFGSRIDDCRRGGDIDLLVATPHEVTQPARTASLLGAELELAMGERKIDVLLQAPNLIAQPIHAIARAQGVLL